MGPRSCLFPLFLIIIIIIIINSFDCYLYSHIRYAMDSPRVEFRRRKTRAHHGRVSCADRESCAHCLPRVVFSFVYSTIPRTVVYWATCRVQAQKNACTRWTRVVCRQRVVCTLSTTCRVLVRLLHYSPYRRVLGHVSPHNISGFSFKKYFEEYLIFIKHLWGFFFLIFFLGAGEGGAVLPSLINVTIEGYQCGSGIRF